MDVTQKALEEFDSLVVKYFLEINNIRNLKSNKNVDKLITLRKEIVMMVSMIVYEEIGEIFDVITKNIIVETNTSNTNLLKGSNYYNEKGITNAFDLLRKFIIRYYDVQKNYRNMNT